jgi:nucleoside-triphosphatase THEP1
MADQPSMLTALLYAQGEGAVIGRLAEVAQARGLRVAGMVQKDERRPDRRRCDMSLVDLASGTEIPISQDRGRDARGCRLDHGALEEAAALAMRALDADPLPDLLVLSKFGKREIEGHGFRQMVERAVELGVPVLVGVGSEHVAGFRDFAGEYGIVLDHESEARDWLSVTVGHVATQQ